MAKDVPQMVRGLGMATRFISLLTEEIKKRGGHDEMLHFLTTPRGAESLAKVAEFITSLKWQVPKSYLMEEARRDSVKDYKEVYADHDEHFQWSLVLSRLGLPFTKLNAEYDDADGRDQEIIPLEIRQQLEGKEAFAGMPVTWKNEPFILTQLSCGAPSRQGEILPGQKIIWNNLMYICLTPVGYIDLER